MSIDNGRIATSQNYVSSLSFVHKPQVFEKLVSRYNDTKVSGIANDFQMMKDRVKPVAASFCTHLEEGHILEVIVVGADVASPGAGNPITITLPAADHLFSGTVSHPQVGMQVLIADTIYGWISDVDTTTPNAHTIDITPNNGATIPALVTGDEIVIIGNAYADGTGQPDGFTPKPESFTSYLQILKKTYQVTGSEQANQTWIKVKTKDGGMKDVWFYKGERDTFLAYNAYIDQTMIMQEYSTRTGVDTYGRPAAIQTTQGIVPFIRSRGITGIPSAGFDMDSMDDLILALDRNFAENENFLYSGLNLTLEIDNFLTDQMKSDEINYSPFRGGAEGREAGKDKAISLGFRSFEKGGFTFYFKTLSSFTNPKSFGATGFKYPSVGLVIPAGKGKNAKGEEQYYLQMLYKSYDKENRRMKHWLTGGNAPTPTDDRDVLEFNYSCEVGMQGMAGNKFAIIED